MGPLKENRKGTGTYKGQDVEIVWMKKSEKAKGKERASAEKKRNTVYIAAGVCVCILVAAALFFVFGQPAAKAGDTVSVYYIGMVENGSVFDSNLNKSVFTFTIGADTVIPGFEDAVIGMKKGEVKTVTIPSDQAYGAFRSDMVFAVNGSLFSSENPPVVDNYYSIVNPTDGSTNYFRVVAINDNDTVTIDENNVLAGQDLTFTIRLVGITQEQ